MISCKPLGVANISNAALFRTIELVQPTLLIDEADTFLRDNDDLRGALNAGHKRGGQVIRCVGDDADPRRLCQRSGLLVSNMLRLRSRPFKQLAGYRARWLSGAYGESAVPRRERVGTCEIEGGGSSGVRRDRGNIVLLMGRS
jgi:hypothetical protein